LLRLQNLGAIGCLFQMLQVSAGIQISSIIAYAFNGSMLAMVLLFPLVS
jgi:hypothetical protein